MLNGAVTEAPGTEADGWRGANHLELGVEREALYLEKREQEDTRAARWDGLCPQGGRGSSRHREQHSQPRKTGTSREAGRGNTECWKTMAWKPGGTCGWGTGCTQAAL